MTKSSPVRELRVYLSGLALLGVVFTALAHALFLLSLRCLSAQRVAVVTALEPVYGMLFAWLLFADVPSGQMLLGGAVIMLATTWASWRDGEAG